MESNRNLPPYPHSDSPSRKVSGPSAAEIQDWLVAQIAGLMAVDAADIGLDEPFNSFGLSSREAVLLSGDLEDWLSCRLSPTILYEYPTIEALSLHLAKYVQPDGPAFDSAVVPARKAQADESGQDSSKQSTVLWETRDDELLGEGLNDTELEALLLDRLDEMDKGNE